MDSRDERPAEVRPHFLLALGTALLCVLGIWIVVRPPRWLLDEPAGDSDQVVSTNGNGHGDELDAATLARAEHGG